MVCLCHMHALPDQEVQSKVRAGLVRSARSRRPWVLPALGGDPFDTTTCLARSQSHCSGDFPTHGEKPRIGGVACEHFVSAKRRLDCRGRFEAVVSGLRNPVSRQQRLAQAETGLNPSLTAE